MSENEAIRIGQMSDLHLGNRQYGIFQRAIDFFNAAKTAADLLIAQDPHLILIPGDIFERARPYPVDQRHAINVLTLFKERDIPVFAIRGNHDASYAWSKRQGGNEIHVLQDLGLVTLLEDTYKEITLGNGQSVRVWGFGYHGNETSAKLTELVEENKDVLADSSIPNVLLVHEYLENMLSSARLTEYALDILGFEYIAIGHYHSWWINGSETMCCTGSTEHVSAAEWVNPERSVALITLSRTSDRWTPKVEQLSYKVRPKKRRELDLGTVTLEEAADAVADTLQELDEEETMIRVDVRGTLSDTQQSLDIRDLVHQTEKAFHVEVVPELDYAGLPIREDISDTEVMEEVFVDRLGVSKERAPSWVGLAQDMKEILVEPLDDRAEASLLDCLHAFVDDDAYSQDVGGEEE